MKTIRLFVSIFLAEIFAFGPAFAAAGTWNGVAFTAWNGVAQTSWNGTAISCAGSTPSDILFAWNMEGGTWSNAEYSIGSGTGTVSSATQDTSVFKVGAASELAGGATQEVSFSGTSNINPNSGGIGFWLYYNTIGNNFGLFKAELDGNNRVFIVSSSGTGKLRFFYVSGGAGGFDLTPVTYVMTTGAWYFVSMKWSLVAGTVSYDIEVWTSLGVSLGQTTGSGATGDWPGNPATIDIGEWAGNSGSANIDNVHITNDYSRDLHAIASTVYP